MKKGSLLLMICLILSGFMVNMPDALAGEEVDPGEVGNICFDYILDTYSGYTTIAHLIDGLGNNMGSVEIYNDETNVYLRVTVWSKPWLAYREKPLDKDGDGILGPDASDKNGDGDIDKYDLKSDGIEIHGLGNHPDHSGYIWYVDSWADDSPKPYRDSEISVPSWTDGPNDLADPWGILTGPIVYLATIPIPEGQTSFEICIEVHASPPTQPQFWVPELPLGTISMIMAALTALGIYLRTRSKIIHI